MEEAEEVAEKAVEAAKAVGGAAPEGLEGTGETA